MENKWIKEITIEDLPEPYHAIAVEFGLSKAMEFVRNYGGCEIYFPKLEKILQDKRDKAIINEFNGYNYRKLAKKYNLSERQIRNICNEAMQKKRNEPLADQISIFEIE